MLNAFIDLCCRAINLIIALALAVMVVMVVRQCGAALCVPIPASPSAKLIALAVVDHLSGNAHHGNCAGLST